MPGEAFPLPVWVRTIVFQPNADPRLLPDLELELQPKTKTDCLIRMRLSGLSEFDLGAASGERLECLLQENTCCAVGAKGRMLYAVGKSGEIVSVKA